MGELGSYGSSVAAVVTLSSVTTPVVEVSDRDGAVHAGVPVAVGDQAGH